LDVKSFKFTLLKTEKNAMLILPENYLPVVNPQLVSFGSLYVKAQIFVGLAGLF
jgi:hypothetical protein